MNATSMDVDAAPDRCGADDMNKSLTIDVFFDFVCPWCLIGKRNLQIAASRLAEARPDVTLKVLWRSYPLLPDTPIEGVDYQDFYVARLGSREAVARRRSEVRQAGAAAGLDFAFERITRLPNTAAAHNLVAYAARHCNEAQEAELIERLFRAYFTGGEDIGDVSVLERLGLECGLERAGLAQHIAESRSLRGRLKSASPAERYSVSGVPFFYFNGSQALSGAHPPDALFASMLRSIRT